MSAYSKLQPNEARVLPSGQTRRVYVDVVVPVFNRCETTLQCINRLKQQNTELNEGRHIVLSIMICDGGSTDGTVQKIAQQHPDVIILQSAKETWWGGSTRLGIDHALQKDSLADFLLVMNDDTDFCADYLRLLVDHPAASRRILCGIVVDALDRQRVIDAGVALNWKNFGFSCNRDTNLDADGLIPSDVLSGRGTLFPMAAVRKAGSIDSKNFPHYLSDYEFSMRVSNTAGIPLSVHPDAKIYTVEAPPRPAAEENRNGLLVAWNRLQFRLSKRAKSNLPAALVFVWRHAPQKKRWRLLGTLLISNAYFILLPIRERNIVPALIKRQPYYRFLVFIVKLFFGIIKGVVAFILRIIRLFSMALFGSIFISEEDVDAAGLSLLRLRQHHILSPLRNSGYFQLTRSLGYVRSNMPEALPLIRAGRNPLRKLIRLLKTIARHPFLAKPRRLARFLAQFAVGAIFIAPTDFEQAGLSKERLVQHQIFTPLRNTGYFRLSRSQAYVSEHVPEALPLIQSARDPVRKIRRLFKILSSWCHAHLMSFYDKRYQFPQPLRIVLSASLFVYRTLFCRGFIMTSDLQNCGIDPYSRVARENFDDPDGYGFLQPSHSTCHISSHLPAATKLVRSSRNPFFKLKRILRTFVLSPARDFSIAVIDQTRSFASLIRKKMVLPSRHWKDFFRPQTVHETRMDRLGIKPEILFEKEIVVQNKELGGYRTVQSYKDIKRLYPEALHLFSVTDHFVKMMGLFWSLTAHRARRLKTSIASLRYMAERSFIVTPDDIVHFNMCEAQLYLDGLLNDASAPGFYTCSANIRDTDRHYPEYSKLFRFLAHPSQKFPRLIKLMGSA